MNNLLNETLEVLKCNKKKESDIKWVGTRTHKSTWDNFKEVSDIEYDDGWGSAEIPMDLIIVGDNWWLERAEYDGSEWWEYKEYPKEPTKEIELKAITENQSIDLGINKKFRCRNSLIDINKIKGNK